MQRIEHWWRHLWEKGIWYYKNAIKEMVYEGVFIPDDLYQRASFIAVFLPLLQQAVDEYVGIWNSHLVRRINENGRFRPSHVPARYFREYERLHGWDFINLNFPLCFEIVKFIATLVITNFLFVSCY
jgi:hypothetical protein